MIPKPPEKVRKGRTGGKGSTKKDQNPEGGQHSALELRLRKAWEKRKTVFGKSNGRRGERNTTKRFKNAVRRRRKIIQTKT